MDLFTLPSIEIRSIWRAKTSKKDLNWLYGNLITIDSNYMLCFKGKKGINMVPVDVNSVNQYTRCKDKFWKDIFEKDIVKAPTLDSEGCYIEGSYENALVEYKYGEFLLIYSNSDEDEQYILENYCEDLEVIGNLYDNPELFKEN